MKHWRIIFLLLCSLAIFPVAHGQYNSLLWKVSGNGLQKPSYLFGTMHVADARAFQFSDSLMPAFRSVNAYAMELDIDKSLSLELLGKLMMGGNRSIRKMIPEAQYKTLDSVFRLIMPGVSVRLFDNLAPIVLQMMIDTKTMGISDSSIEGNSAPMDMYFNNLAKAQKKKIIGIETIEEQLKALNALSYPEQAELLTESLMKLNSGAGDEYNLMYHYQNQNLDSLLEKNNFNSVPPKFYKALVTDRNVRMANRMDKIMQTDPAFMAVGALHLAGEQGVVALLRAKGYTLMPLR